MSMTETPHYRLTAPLMIGTRLTPAIAVGSGYVSVEAHGIEPDGRAHFRVHVDASEIDSWTSEDSFVTVMGHDWTHAAMMALEVVCDAFGSDELTDSLDATLPADMKAWLDNGASMDAMCAAEDIREAIESYEG